MSSPSVRSWPKGLPIQPSFAPVLSSPCGTSPCARLTASRPHSPSTGGSVAGACTSSTDDLQPSIPSIKTTGISHFRISHLPLLNEHLNYRGGSLKVKSPPRLPVEYSGKKPYAIKWFPWEVRMKITRLVCIRGFMVLLCAGACAPQVSPGSTESAEPAPPAATAKASPKIPPTPAIRAEHSLASVFPTFSLNDPDTVCLLHFMDGLSCVDPSGWRSYPNDQNSPVSTIPRAMVSCLD